MLGTPARLPGIVYRSDMYMDTGSAAFSPKPNATLVVTGPAITSHFVNACWNSSAISRRTCCALM